MLQLVTAEVIGAGVVAGLLAAMPAALAADQCAVAISPGSPKSLFQKQIDACSKLIEAGKRKGATLTSRALFYRGYALEQIDKHKQALADFDASLKLSPDCGEVYYYRGIAKHELGQTETALADLTKAIELNNKCSLFGPLEAWRFLQRGYTRVDAKDYVGAIDDLGEAIDIMYADQIEYEDSDVEDALYQRARLYWATKEWEKSLADLKTLASDFPDFDVSRTRGDLQKTVFKACDNTELDPHQRLSACNVCIEIGDDCADSITFYRRATIFDALNERDKALADINEALRRTPDEPDFLAERGSIHVNRNENEAGLADLDNALDGKHETSMVYFSETVAYLMRGFAHQSLGDPQKAVDDFTKALKTEDADKLKPELLENRASSLLALHRLDDAERDLKAAQVLQPDSPDLKRLFDQLNQQRTAAPAPAPAAAPPDAEAVRDCRGKDPQKRIAGCSKLLDDPNTAADLKTAAHLNRAIAYSQQRQLQEAIDDLSAVLAQRPDDTQLLYTRGVTYARTGQYDKAIGDLSTMIHLKPDAADGYKARGRIYELSGDAANAAADYEKTLYLMPGDKETTAWLAALPKPPSKPPAAVPDAVTEKLISDCESGDIPRALTACGKLIAMDGIADSVRANAYLEHGYALGRQDKNQDAIDDFTQSIRLDPKQAHAFIARGLAHAQLRQDKEALADFSQAIEIDPQNGDAHFFRGILYARVDTPEDDATAIADMSAAIEADPQRARAYYIRGMLYERAKDLDRARADLEKTLQIDHSNDSARQELKKLQK